MIYSARPFELNKSINLENYDKSHELFKIYLDLGFMNVFIYHNPIRTEPESLWCSYMTRKTQRMFIIAKPHDFCSFLYVDNPDDIPRHLMRSSYWAQYRHQTLKNTELHVKEEPSNIQYVKPELITVELAQLAVDHNVNLFKYVAKYKLLPEETLIRILEEDPNQIRHFSKKMTTDKIAEIAIINNPSSIAHFKRKNLPSYLYLHAVASDGELIGYVPHKYRTREVFERAFEKYPRAVFYMHASDLDTEDFFRYIKQNDDSLRNIVDYIILRLGKRRLLNNM